MAVIRTYHCPCCQTCISPLIGLITKPFIQCSQCPTRVYVSRDMVIDNWSRNFYLLCVLAIWLGLAVYAFISPPRHGGNADPVAALVGMALLGWLPALLAALPVIPIGYVLGHVVACFVAKGPPQLEPPPPGRYGSGRVPQEHEWR